MIAVPALKRWAKEKRRAGKNNGGKLLRRRSHLKSAA
jgi:hypothetical protein